MTYCSFINGKLIVIVDKWLWCKRNKRLGRAVIGKIINVSLYLTDTHTVTPSMCVNMYKMYIDSISREWVTKVTTHIEPGVNINEASPSLTVCVCFPA